MNSVDMSEKENLEKNIQGLLSELGNCADRFGNGCRLYQRWDLGLTVAAIVFTLLTAVTGTLEDPAVHLINAAWSIYNLALLLVIIRAAVWQPE